MKEQRSIFLDRWTQAEYINAKLGGLVMVLSGVCVFLVGSLVYTAFLPKPVYYIPSSSGAGRAYPNYIPNGVASVFASSWVLDWTNFTPATVREVYERARHFMSPALLAKTDQRLNKDLEDVKRNQMSSLFTIKQDPSVETQGHNFIVIIRGEKNILMGKETVSSQAMIYRIFLKSVSPTDINPYGLVIDQLDQEAES